MLSLCGCTWILTCVCACVSVWVCLLFAMLYTCVQICVILLVSVCDFVNLQYLRLNFCILLDMNVRTELGKDELTAIS